MKNKNSNKLDADSFEDLVRKDVFKYVEKTNKLHYLCLTKKEEKYLHKYQSSLITLLKSLKIHFDELESGDFDLDITDIRALDFDAASREKPDDFNDKIKKLEKFDEQISKARKRIGLTIPAKTGRTEVG